MYLSSYRPVYSGQLNFGAVNAKFGRTGETGQVPPDSLEKHPNKGPTEQAKIAPPERSTGLPARISPNRRGRPVESFRR